MLPDKVEEVRQERSSVYGPWRNNMRGTSMQMGGLIEQFAANTKDNRLPQWWAPLMMCAVKLNRIASGNYHEDNFTDLIAYLQMVREMQREEAS